MTKAIKAKGVPSHSPASPAISGKSKKGKKKKKKKNTQARVASKVYTRPPSKGYPLTAPSPQTAKKGKSTAAPGSSAAPETGVHHEDLHEDSGLGDRPIVDDCSDRQSIISYGDEESVESPTLYEEASTFISSYGPVLNYFPITMEGLIHLLTGSYLIQTPRTTRSAVWHFYNP
jgi:hypothetical protein